VDDRYREQRQEVDAFFGSAKPLGAPSISASPSGSFQLEIAEYGGPEARQAYSRGIVTRTSDGSIVGDIKRNDDRFWYRWVSHPNGKEYLLCGEDYQGYSCLNLTDGRYQEYFPEDGHKGMGFIWVDAYPSPDGLVLAVDGCYWACPYEVVFYDFRNPDQLPYPELGRAEASTQECEGWVDNDTFAYSHMTGFRLSDGKEWGELSEPERAEWLKNPGLHGRREDRVVAKRPALPKGDTDA
jgi:hypothetical protein